MAKDSKLIPLRKQIAMGKKGVAVKTASKGGKKTNC